MVSASHDMIDAFFLKFAERFPVATLQHLTESEDGIQRRAQFMAHRRQKFGFGIVGCFGAFFGLQQFSLYLFMLSNVDGNRSDGINFTVSCFDREFYDLSVI